MIQLEQVEPGIVIYHWIGQVTMAHSEAAFAEFVKDHDNTPFVDIIDLTQMQMLPRDVTGLRAMIKREQAIGLKGYVALNVPRYVEPLVKPLSILAPTTYKFAHSRDEAITLAREILQVAKT